MPTGPLSLVRRTLDYLACPVASNPPPDLVLTPVGRKGHTVREWLTTFELLFCAVDPFAHESAWILPTARRILTVYDEADCRVAWLCTGTDNEAKMFLSQSARDILTFVDPDHTAVKGFGLT